MFKLLLVWRAFVGWWRSLLIAIGTHKKIDINKKIQDMTKIINDALDAQGNAPKVINTEPEATPTKVKPRLFRRLLDRVKKPVENKLW